MNRRLRRALATLIAAVASVVVVACGDDEPAHTPVTPASDFSSPEDGIAFRAPKAATVDRGSDEQVAVLRRGESTLTISRFQRDERLPDSKRELERAAGVLPGEYEARGEAADARSSVENVADHDAVLVKVDNANKATEHIHFYEYGNEIVVDMVSPESDVARATAVLFDPVLNTLKITKPQGQ